MKKDFLTINELRQHAKSLVGKTIGEISSSYQNSSNKGSIGMIIEEGGFHYSPNSKQGPDFEQLNVELKVTPFVRLRNGNCSAKERLVLNIINYMEEVHLDFETSSFWTKNKTLEILFYEYMKDTPQEQLRIEYEYLHQFSAKDLLIIQADWETIVGKIRQGLAHELSEGDTLYLGACTKGANSQSVREQPYSPIKAMQRAYSLKSSYMTKLLRKELCHGDNDQPETLVSETELKNNRFEDVIRAKLLKYRGVKTDSLLKEHAINPQSKAAYVQLVSKMLGMNGNINQSEEFLLANISSKTIRINKKGRLKESMSFPSFKYEYLVQEVWEESRLRQRFEEQKFMFIIFKEDSSGHYYLWDVVFWNMNQTDIETRVKEVWEDTKMKVSSGLVYKKVGETNQYHFLNKSQTEIIHVRPHGQNRLDTYPLPVKDQLTGFTSAVKMCFFLNNDYILKQIKDYL
jgi:DNA mismatch repair protein MutH